MRIIVALLCLLACLTVSRAEGREKKHVAPCSQTASQLYELLYLEAVCQREAGNAVAQFRLLERAIKENPRGAEAYFELSQFGIQHNADVPVMTYLELAHELSPDNHEFTIQYVRVLLGNGDDKGVELARSLLADEQLRDDVYALLCDYYVQLRDYAHLCQTLEEWRPISGDDVFISSNKLQAAMALGQLDDALLIADTLISLAPTNATRYKVAKGEILLGLNRTDEALALYDAMSADDKNDPGAQILLYKYAIKTTNRELETQTLKQIVGNTDMQTPTREAALRQYLGDASDPKCALRRDTLLNILLPLPEKDATLYNAMLAELRQSEAPDSLYALLFNKLLEIDPANEYARISLMQISLRADDYGEVQRLCTDGLKQNARQPLFYYFGGAALMTEKKFDEALSLFERGRNYIDDRTNTELVSSFYGSYGDALHQVGRNEEAYAMYDSALVYNNGNEMCLNNYAYFLALDNQQLDKAERMSAYTIEARPDNATFLDTYAWILFLKGEYEKAREYIDRAIDNIEDRADQDNSSLYEHAGDIYYHIGLVDEALDFWREAYSLDAESTILKKKITNKKYYKD